MNEPKELIVNGWTESSVPMNTNDIVTIGGIYNRPATNTLGWWLILIFGGPFALLHFERSFRRRVDEPLSYFPFKRRELFEPRELQKFKITGAVTS